MSKSTIVVETIETIVPRNDLPIKIVFNKTSTSVKMFGTITVTYINDTYEYKFHGGRGSGTFYVTRLTPQVWIHGDSWKEFKANVVEELIK